MVEKFSNQAAASTEFVPYPLESRAPPSVERLKEIRRDRLAYRAKVFSMMKRTILPGSSSPCG